MPDINYYYNNMDVVIQHVKTPLDKFTSIQEQISKEVKAIGGNGRIHGAIIDLDFYNHIYVNPVDLTITGYWARDMVDKKVFSSISKLLEINCPVLYDNYEKQIKSKSNNEPIIFSDKMKKKYVHSIRYLETDIYEASREIKRLQKLNSNILCEWYEPVQKYLKK